MCAVRIFDSPLMHELNFHGNWLPCCQFYHLRSAISSDSSWEPKVLAIGFSRKNFLGYRQLLNKRARCLIPKSITVISKRGHTRRHYDIAIFISPWYNALRQQTNIEWIRSRWLFLLSFYFERPPWRSVIFCELRDCKTTWRKTPHYRRFLRK